MTMMHSATYLARRGRIETYFDRTAAEAWSRLTSDAPVGGIRATVRAGRERMRVTLLSWLPARLDGRRLLDAGCGTGAFATEAAARGAAVVAVDLSPTLVRLARERRGGPVGDIGADPQGFPKGDCPLMEVQEAKPPAIEFHVGDMTDPALGAFDHIVAMDSPIHYRTPDMARAVTELAARARVSVLFTFAPRTRALAAMHALGRLFPRGSRAPAIEPVREDALLGLLRDDPALAGWRIGRTRRIASGFYTSQALELVRR